MLNENAEKETRTAVGGLVDPIVRCDTREIKIQQVLAAEAVVIENLKRLGGLLDEEQLPHERADCSPKELREF